MKLFRFYKPFIDPRDNEEYRVCRVFDPISEDYAVWLADNLRATTYSDGTPLGENDVKFYTPQEGEDESWTKVSEGITHGPPPCGALVEQKKVKNSRYSARRLAHTD